MDTPQQLDATAKANLEDVANVILEVSLIKQQFIQCHEFVAKNTYRLVELLCHAESRGVLLEKSLTLVDVGSGWR
jgi:hypothetical protein